LFNFKFIPLTF